MTKPSHTSPGEPGVTTRIDPARCTGCGACVEVCPSDTLRLAPAREPGPAPTAGGEAKGESRAVATVTGTDCLYCEHCVAICPEEAVVVDALQAQPHASWLSLETLAVPRQTPSHLGPAVTPEDLIQLFHQRRSCRSYRKKAVPEAVLRDLVRIATLAPSGTNSQRWTFHLLPEGSAVSALGELIGRFFGDLNRVVSIPPVRWLSRLHPADPLGQYYRDYRERVDRALREHAETGRDRLFHGAPAAVLIGALPGASTGAEDAMLAADHLVLAAQSMNLGTCHIGFAVEAIRADPRIRRALGLSAGERIHAVVALGYPKRAYLRPTRRFAPRLSLWRGPKP